jgi:hypothetical protein
MEMVSDPSAVSDAILATAVHNVPEAIDVLSYRIVEGGSSAVASSGMAAGAAAGALIGSVPGALVGGLIGAIGATRLSHEHVEYELSIKMHGVVLTRCTRWSEVQALAKAMKEPENGHREEVVALAGLLPTKRLVVSLEPGTVVPGSGSDEDLRVQRRIVELRQFFGRLLVLWRELLASPDTVVGSSATEYAPPSAPTLALFHEFFALPIGLPTEEEARAQGEVRAAGPC